ncbi:MAG: hypothetical protein IPQ08_00055 [Chitinophagaceae bacterium]|nr:hypothetical protein [Chitinophagaceae bacterium]
MPKQAGHIKLIGSIDGLNYYKSRDGFIVRKNPPYLAAVFSGIPVLKGPGKI